MYYLNSMEYTLQAKTLLYLKLIVNVRTKDTTLHI